tara:strand:+ start:313 stop:564 length:252 start_codon:yes stop_codon:yes gene_type:complete
MSLNRRPNRLRCASRQTHVPHALNVLAKPQNVKRGCGSFGSTGESFLRFDFFFFVETGCHRRWSATSLIFLSIEPSMPRRYGI